MGVDGGRVFGAGWVLIAMPDLAGITGISYARTREQRYNGGRLKGGHA
jgi:hypothetical protein